MFKVVQYDNNLDELTTSWHHTLRDALEEYTALVGMQVECFSEGYIVDIFEYDADGEHLLGLVCEHNTYVR